ncbi:glycosyltransferase family 2 protein [Telmatocola sphagniphila]|jgi:glycosyltransferase involved in cell wall biosynthesis|uniref:Glycosyltransferase family 2 protein n=1 Tax=Telmatocola sphagniphila TaxID=1123043 RepID=A0A8E6B709_9BACT|nr:glycosyltransferase family 2 protein [Telmatocola sphagniphila]QVL33072.1 glycosyltransferase family 2 protein [Telmatocola sphagniphila]
MRKLSIVIPIKDEQDNLKPLHALVVKSLQDWGPWELIFVDDGSTDRSPQVLSDLAQADSRVKVIRLRKNFGQAAATQAGLDAATGDLIATMDGDIQNDPSDLTGMIAKLDEGYDVILGERAKRKDGMLLRKVPSYLANRLIRKVAGIPFRDFGCAIRVMKAEFAHGLKLYGEMHRFITVLLMNQGARIAQLPVKHHARNAGTSKYGIGRTGRVILDLITIKFLSGYLTRPMHFLGGIGLTFVGAGVVALAATVLMKMISGLWMTGNPLLHLSVMLTLVGMQFVSMGVIGEVVVRTYFESQSKSPYSVRETLNIEEPNVAERKAA